MNRIAHVIHCYSDLQVVAQAILNAGCRAKQSFALLQRIVDPMTASAQRVARHKFLTEGQQVAVLVERFAIEHVEQGALCCEAGRRQEQKPC